MKEVEKAPDSSPEAFTQARIAEELSAAGEKPLEDGERHSILSNTQRAAEARERIAKIWSEVPESAYKTAGPQKAESARTSKPNESRGMSSAIRAAKDYIFPPRATDPGELARIQSQCEKMRADLGPTALDRLRHPIKNGKISFYLIWRMTRDEYDPREKPKADKAPVLRNPFVD